MKKESVGLIAQLLDGMRDALEKLEDAYKRRDDEMLVSAKREILQFQAEIKSLL